MWVYTTFEPVAAFGLRPSNTTSSGGKSLVCPTPYAIKMALMDRLIREMGLSDGLTYFEAVRDMNVWLSGSAVLAVTRTFQKVFRPGKTKPNPDTGRMDVWTSTIAQRELVIMSGSLTLGFDCSDDALSDLLLPTLAGINYFGKRGSFMQLSYGAYEETGPRDGFTNLSRPPDASQLGFGFLQRMDDMRPDATFEDVDAINGSPRGDGGRISYTVVLPYELNRHAFNHTVYARKGAVIR